MAETIFEVCAQCKRKVWLEKGFFCCRCREEATFTERLRSDPRGLAIELKAQVEELEERVDDLDNTLCESSDW